MLSRSAVPRAFFTAPNEEGWMMASIFFMGQSSLIADGLGNQLEAVFRKEIAKNRDTRLEVQPHNAQNPRKAQGSSSHDVILDACRSSSVKICVHPCHLC